MALLLENTGGFLPFGVSPRHIAILPVSTLHATYANSIVDELRHACPDAFVEVIDATSASLGKRVRECVKNRVSLIWTVGDDEVAKTSVSMRWSKSSDTTVPCLLSHHNFFQIQRNYCVSLSCKNRFSNFLMRVIS